MKGQIQDFVRVDEGEEDGGEGDGDVWKLLDFMNFRVAMGKIIKTSS